MQGVITGFRVLLKPLIKLGKPVVQSGGLGGNLDGLNCNAFCPWDSIRAELQFAQQGE